MLNSQLKQFEETDKLDKKEEIEQIIRETKDELRKTRIVCYILSIITLLMCLAANWTPNYFNFDEKSESYFLGF